MRAEVTHAVSNFFKRVHFHEVALVAGAFFSGGGDEFFVGAFFLQSMQYLLNGLDIRSFKNSLSSGGFGKSLALKKLISGIATTGCCSATLWLISYTGVSIVPLVAGAFRFISDSPAPLLA